MICSHITNYRISNANIKEYGEVVAVAAPLISTSDRSSDWSVELETGDRGWDWLSAGIAIRSSRHWCAASRVQWEYLFSTQHEIHSPEKSNVPRSAGRKTEGRLGKFWWCCHDHGTGGHTRMFTSVWWSWSRQSAAQLCATDRAVAFDLCSVYTWESKQAARVCVWSQWSATTPLFCHTPNGPNRICFLSGRDLSSPSLVLSFTHRAASYGVLVVLVQLTVVRRQSAPRLYC